MLLQLFQNAIATTTQLQNTIAQHVCKIQLQNTIAKCDCKTLSQNNNQKTAIEKQQVLKQFVETLRGSPPGAAHKNIKTMHWRYIRGTPSPEHATELLKKPLRTHIGYSYHWGKITFKNGCRHFSPKSRILYISCGDNIPF